MFLAPPPPAFDGRPLLVDDSGRALEGLRTLCGGRRKRWIIEVNGGGLALEDFDGDGDLDLLIVDGSTVERVEAGTPGEPPRLYLNDGSGRFAPAGEAWAIAPGRWGMGVATGDLDEDGWPDLVLTEWGVDRVLRNLEGKGFEELAPVGPASWSSSAALFDIDGDGHLDLFVSGYLAFDPHEIPPAGESPARWKGHPVLAGPEGLPPLPDRLHLGRGDGTFGPNVLPDHPAAFGLGVMPCDVDRDGDLDLLVANDSMPNHLWISDGKGGLEEQGFASGLAYDPSGREQASMGIARGDLDGDGDEDLFLTNFSGEANALYHAQRPGRFREIGGRMGIGRASLTRLGWGTGAGDFDLDGDLDLFVLNGHVYPQADAPGTGSSYAQSDQLLLAQGGHFEAIELDPRDPRCSRAGAAADLDGDGDLDLVALAVEGPVRFWRGLAADQGRGRGMVVRPEGRAGGPASQAIGARVEARAGDRHWSGLVLTAGGYQAALPAEVHLGLGDLELLDELIVTWPDGTTRRLAPVPVRPRLFVARPKPEEGE